MKRIAIALSALALLSGCATTDFVRPSDDKLVCPDEPPAPPRNGPNGRVTDEDAGEYMTKLRESWRGCWSDVVWMRDWFNALPR